MSRSGTQPEAVVLIEGIAWLPSGGILRIVGTGIGAAALIVVVAGDIDDGADAQGAAESDGEAMAGIAVIPCRIEQETEPSNGCALGQAIAHIDIVAFRVEQDSESTESSASRSHVELVDIVAVVID